MSEYEEKIQLRSRKQQFLIDEIKNKGYDLEEFAKEMGAKKKDGLDIDNWKMNELSVVRDLIEVSLDCARVPDVRTKEFRS